MKRNTSQVTDVAYKDVSIEGLRACAQEYFAPKGMGVSGISSTHIPGVPVLGQIFPQTFGPCRFDSFKVVLERDDRTETDYFEVTSRAGRAGTFEVVRGQFTPNRSGTVYNGKYVFLKKNLPFGKALEALGIK